MSDVAPIDYDSVLQDIPLVDPLPWLDALAREQGRPLGTIAGADDPFGLMGFIRNLLGFPGKAVDWLWARFLDVWAWVQKRGDDLFWQLHDTVRDMVLGVEHAIGDVFGWLWGAAHWVGDRVADVIGFLWGLTFNVLTWVWDAAHWVADQVVSVVGSVFGWVWDAGRWIVSQLMSGVGSVFGWLWDAARWAVSQVFTGIGQVFTWLWDGLRWLDAQLAGHATTIVNNISDLGQKVIEDAPRIVVQGAAAIGEGFLAGLTWFVEHAFDPVADALAVKASIPHKMLTGQYKDVHEILADWEDPLIPGSLVHMLYSAIAAGPSLVALTSRMGGIYAEAPAQEVLKVVGPTLPGAGEARDAYLRGFIDEATVDDVLGRHGFEAERIAWLKRLFFEPPGLDEAIQMLERGALGSGGSAHTASLEELPPALKDFARQVGIDEPVAFSKWAAHWQLAGLADAMDQWHRGIVDESAVDDLLRGRGVLPFWRAPMKAASFTIPNRRELRGLFTAGVITEDQLAQSYAALGFPPDLVTVYVDYAKRTAAGAPATLPRDIVLTAFRDRFLTRDQAAAELAALKFTPEDVDLFLALEDYKLEQANVADAEAIVEADLKAGSISDGAAIEQLQALGLPQTRAVLLVNRWRRRAAVRTSTLSASEVQRLLKEQLINEDSAIARFRVLGYNEADARFLVELAGPAPAAKPSPELTVSQLRQAVRAGIITEADANARLHRLGWSDPDIAILDRLTDPATTTKAPPELTLAELLKATKAGVIDTAQLTDRLQAKGYEPADIEVLLASEKLGPAVPSTADLVKARTLNVAQLQKAFKDELISEDELRGRLAALGYPDADVELLVELVSSKAPSAQSA